MFSSSPHYAMMMIKSNTILDNRATNIENLFLVFLLFIGFLSTQSSCSKSDHIPPELNDLLKASGVQDIKLDFTYQTPDIPNRKYQAITVTYNFSTADGTPQKEYRGFILKYENDTWKVDHSTSYTKSAEKAKSLLEGKK
jgi:hypothetical protein